MSTINPLAQCQLYADPEERVLICRRCQYALSTTNSQVTSHLRDKHAVPDPLRKGLTHYLKHIHPYEFCNPADIPIRQDWSPVHPELQVYDGFACSKCAYRTVNNTELRRHISKEHLRGQYASRKNVENFYDDVYLQTWTYGASRRYWIVMKDGQRTRPAVGQDAIAHIKAVLDREESRLELERQACLSKKDTGAQTFNTTSPWIERTRWHITYRKTRRDLLQGLTWMPDLRCLEFDHCIGRGHTDDNDTSSSSVSYIYSPWQDEHKIARLTVLVDWMFDRCEETMQHTSRSLLCWLRSTRPHVCYPKPFTLVALEKSKKQYRQLWKRFIAFVFRLFRMPTEIRRQITRVRFTRLQLNHLQAIWEHTALGDSRILSASGLDYQHISKDGLIEENDGEVIQEEEEEEEEEEEGERDYEDDDREEAWKEEEDEGSAGESDEDGDKESGDNTYSDYRRQYIADEDTEDISSETIGEALICGLDELLELVFQISIMFSKDDLVDGQPSSSLLVYYSGILGFSPGGLDFLPAKRFTTHLSGLIYLQRLLFLELALPYRGYRFLDIPQRSRFQQHEQLDTIRKKYMVTGSASPLEELLSLRDYGRVVARDDPPSYLLRWSDDGQTVFYGDVFSLTMQNFRRLPRYFIDKAEQICQGLMFGLDPVIDLAKIKDDITNTETGFSFISHPANQLNKAYLGLSKNACTTRRNGLFRKGRWDWEAIYLYQKETEELEEMLAGLLHTSCGQVGRAPELFSLQCQNSLSSERGIYVWNGSLIYVTRHHKAKRSTDREFNVVRLLPVEAGHLLYKYLVYIRPLIDMLQRERGSHPLAVNQPSRLLFRTGRYLEKPWDASRLTSILKKATSATSVWGQAVNSQLYRQLSIGITERHVREVHKPFNRFDDRTAEADLNVTLAWQSGHRPLQRGTTYGLDGAYPTKMQPALLRAYEWASTRWHEFIGLPSKTLRARSAAPLSMLACEAQDYIPPPAVPDKDVAVSLPLSSNKFSNATEPSVRISGAMQETQVIPRGRKRRLSPAADERESSSDSDSGVRHSRRRVGIPRASHQDIPKARRHRSSYSPVSSTSPQSYHYTNSSTSDEDCFPSTRKQQGCNVLSDDEGQLPWKEFTADTTLATALRKIKSRVTRWKRGEEHSPVSAEESDSSIDWDRPDVTPREGYGSFPFWARHNARIEAKIEKTRKTVGVFSQASLSEAEGKVFDSLQLWLEEWRDCCVVCHFQLLKPKSPHKTLDCSSTLGQHIRSLALQMQLRMQQLTQDQKSLSCPSCFIPRIICSRWIRGPDRTWITSGKECQYLDVIVPVILTMVEADSRIRSTIDQLLDFNKMPSRNMDRLCEWGCQRAIERPDFYSTRVVGVFDQLRVPWLDRTCTKIGSGSAPEHSWITSIRGETQAIRTADEAAYKTRERERKLQMAREPSRAVAMFVI